MTVAASRGFGRILGCTQGFTPMHRAEQSQSPSDRGPLGRRERKKARIRRDILTAGLALIRDRGYHSATLNDIVDEVDISLGTFFRYFPSKDALLREGVRELFTEFHEVLNAAPSPDEPLGARLERAFAGLARAVVKDKELARAVMASGVWATWINPPGPADAILPGTYPTIQAFTTAQRDSSFRTDLDPHHIAQLLWGATVVVIAQWVTRDAPYDLEKRLRQSVRALLRGIAS
jgi:AcrR family transcriptional regulator